MSGGNQHGCVTLDGIRCSGTVPFFCQYLKNQAPLYLRKNTIQNIDFCSISKDRRDRRSKIEEQLAFLKFTKSYATQVYGPFCMETRRSRPWARMERRLSKAMRSSDIFLAHWHSLRRTRLSVAYVCIPLGSVAVFRIRKVGTKKRSFIVDYCRN